MRIASSSSIVFRNIIGLVLLCPLAIVAPAAGGSCLSGLVAGTTLEGDLGPAPAAPFVEIACLELRDDAGVARSAEVASAGIAIPFALRLTDLSELTLVGPGERRLATQLDVISRWGGPVDDTGLPVRWLRVVVPATLVANGTSSYSLRQYAGLAAASDPFAASITAEADGWRVDTGLAELVIDPTNPALLESIAIDLDDDGVGAKTTVYTHADGAGPHLVYDGGSGDVTLDTGTPGQVVVDPDGFEIVHSGPVEVAVALRGHFVDAGRTSSCNSAGSPYEALGFTAVLSFQRGSRDVGMQLNVRNECSDAFGGSWTDDSALFREATWELPFNLDDQTAYVGGDGPIQASGIGFSGETRVEQRRGSGAPPNWTRRARTLGDSTITPESGELFTRSILALSDATVTAVAQMPWMRYREPVALSATGPTLSLGFVGDTLTVGEGKGIWGFARISLIPTVQLTELGVAASLEAMRDPGLAALERGLLPRLDRATFNATQVMPSLGTGAVHTARTHYLEWMNSLHEETVSPGGQWDRNKTYGSQLWPETGSNDPFGVDADVPNENIAGENYWDPAGNELIQFLASGDPKWAWDFALMGYWIQAFAAYLNTGFNFQGNRNGLAVTSGGRGCPQETPSCTADGTGGGHWHRSASGSDDYTYAMSMELGYAVHPNLPFRDRFAQAGQTVMDRYDPNIPEAEREPFVNAVNFTRQVIQHFEMLANCAELVPGSRGQACHDRLMEVMGELARDNLAAGVICQGQISGGSNGDILSTDPLPTQCYTPQEFMINALMYQFLHRFWSNYRRSAAAAERDIAEAVRRALVEFPAALYTGGPATPTTPPLEQNPDGTLVPLGSWSSITDCDFDATGTSITQCITAIDEGITQDQLLQNHAHTAALLFVAHDIDPSVDLCAVAKAAFDDPALTGGPGDNMGLAAVGHFNSAGWWKGVSQMLQGLAVGVGLYDVCVQDPAADLAVTKSDGVSSLTPGTSLTWQIRVTNNGPQDVRDAMLVDVLDGSRLDVAAATFTCAPVGTAHPGTLCPLAGNAADLAAGLVLDIAAGDSVQFDVTAEVLHGSAGTLVNTATITPPATVADQVPYNNSATDSDAIVSGNAAIDVDGNGVADALTDGLLIIRRLFGFERTALTDGAVGSGCTRCDATAIAAYIDQNRADLDADGNGLTDALTDGLLIIRYLFGFTGTALTDGAVGNGCTHCTADEISGYCATLVP
jgi:hypothetical protein